MVGGLWQYMVVSMYNNSKMFKTLLAVQTLRPKKKRLLKFLLCCYSRKLLYCTTLLLIMCISVCVLPILAIIIIINFTTTIILPLLLSLEEGENVEIICISWEIQNLKLGWIWIPVSRDLFNQMVAMRSNTLAYDLNHLTS